MKLTDYKFNKIKSLSPRYIAGQFFNYRNNQQRLNFLPTLFLFIVLALVFSFSFLNISAFSRNGISVFPFMPNLSLPSKQIDIDNQKLAKQAQDLKTGADLLLAKKQQGENIIIRDSQFSCQLSFTDQSPDYLLVKASVQGFWMPKDCSQENLNFIQIIKITDSQVVLDLKKVDVLSVQLLDSNKNIFALAYLKNTASFDLQLKDFARLLAVPVFPEEDWFSEATAFDINRQADRTFYLDENCNKITAQKECGLWVFDNYSGRLNILVENLETLAREINLSEKSVSFARIQANYPDEIALIAFPTESVTHLELIKIELDTGDLISTASFDRTAQKEDFRMFFR